MKFSHYFQKAKHWHLFLLMFGIPIFFQLFVMGNMISQISLNENSPDLSFMVNYIRLFPIIMILFMGTFFGYFWSIAIGLQHKIPQGLKMKTTKFKIFFFIPLVYILFFLILIGSLMSSMFTGANSGTEPDITSIGLIMSIVFPLHFFSMFCIFYCLYFVAKTLRTIELQRECSFSDFAGEFFLIWFYPIGIWIIQPRINKIAEEEIITPDVV
jgi:hypothetical protein